MRIVRAIIEVLCALAGAASVFELLRIMPKLPPGPGLHHIETLPVLIFGVAPALFLAVLCSVFAVNAKGKRRNWSAIAALIGYAPTLLYLGFRFSHHLHEVRADRPRFECCRQMKQSEEFIRQYIIDRENEGKAPTTKGFLTVDFANYCRSKAGCEAVSLVQPHSDQLDEMLKCTHVWDSNGGIFVAAIWEDEWDRNKTSQITRAACTVPIKNNRNNPFKLLLPFREYLTFP